jgi:tetratricopeptide (TPR) repeat protein
MVPTDTVPPEELIRHQLDHMLASKRFLTAPSQAAFLRLVTDWTMQEKECSENAIGPVLFPGFLKDESLDVRVTIQSLRKTIGKYYAHEGREDLVVITFTKPRSQDRRNLKPGEAYSPTFSYNPEHKATYEMKLGQFFLDRRASLDDLLQASNHFASACVIVPRHLGAVIGQAEALIAFKAAADAYIDDNTGMTLELLSAVKSASPQWWKPHAVHGWLMVVTNHCAEAEAAFNDALSLDDEGTKRYRPYHGYLLKVGKIDEAMRLSRECIVRDPGDTNAYRHHFGVAAYAQRTEETLDFLRNMLSFDRKDSVTFMALGAILMELGQEAAAKKFYEISVHLEQHRHQPYLARLLYSDEGRVNTLIDDVLEFARNGLPGFDASQQKILPPPSA